MYTRWTVSIAQSILIINNYRDLYSKQVAIYHLGLGIALHGLLSSGHTGVAPLAGSIAAKWLQDMEGGSPDQVCLGRGGGD